MVMDVWQGSLGSGKSACMVADMIQHLENGGVCAANFTLNDGWALRIADTYTSVKLGIRDRYKVAQDLYDRFMVVGSVDSLWKATETLMPRVKKSIRSSQFEGWGRLYLDECHKFFNARNWQRNYPYIHWFSQSRKLKWDVTLVAHSRTMVDKQILDLIEYETRFRNLQRVRLLGLFPLAPVPLFLAITRYGGISAGHGTIAKRRLYPIQKFLYSLYDSSLIFNEEPIEEPIHAGERPDSVRPARHGKKVISKARFKELQDKYAQHKIRLQRNNLRFEFSAVQP